MLGTTYLAHIDNLLQKNRLLGIALVVMLAFNVMNWWSLEHARNAVQTVVVPIGGGAGMSIGNGKASEEYLRHIARYITSMTGTYTAGTARPQLQELLLLFAPEVVGTAQVEFERLATQIERFPSISSVQRWAGEKALKATHELIQVRTIKDRLVNGNVSESKQVFYCIPYRIDGGRFWVLAVQEREGDGDDLCLNDAQATPGQSAPKKSAAHPGWRLSCSARGRSPRVPRAKGSASCPSGRRRCWSATGTSTACTARWRSMTWCGRRKNPSR